MRGQKTEQTLTYLSEIPSEQTSGGALIVLSSENLCRPEDNNFSNVLLHAASKKVNCWLCREWKKTGRSCHEIKIGITILPHFVTMDQILFSSLNENSF